jgi:hypothetical protein
MLQQSSCPIGPFLSKGVVLLTFFEKRESKGFFGLIRNEEKVSFERWKIPVIIDEREIPKRSFGSSPHMISTIEVERQHIFDNARNQVQQRILTILEVRSYGLS